MSEALMLQALESTADQIDRLAEIIDEFLTLGEAGVPMSATTRQKYAAEMAELRGHRAQLRKTMARADGSGPDGWVFAAYRGGSNRYQAANVISRLRHAGLTGDYTRHDLRRTVATGLEMLGIPISTISPVLNQQEGGPRATKIYARHTYDREKREALETWGRPLDTLIGAAAPSRLVSFPDRRPEGRGMGC